MKSKNSKRERRKAAAGLVKHYHEMSKLKHLKQRVLGRSEDQILSSLPMGHAPGRRDPEFTKRGEQW